MIINVLEVLEKHLKLSNINKKERNAIKILIRYNDGGSICSNGTDW